MLNINWIEIIIVVVARKLNKFFFNMNKAWIIEENHEFQLQYEAHSVYKSNSFFPVQYLNSYRLPKQWKPISTKKNVVDTINYYTLYLYIFLVPSSLSIQNNHLIAYIFQFLVRAFTFQNQRYSCQLEMIIRLKKNMNHWPNSKGYHKHERKTEIFRLEKWGKKWKKRYIFK